MTAITPQQMRELADDNDVANTVTRGLTLVQRRSLAGESARALRTAADQLEAVRALAEVMSDMGTTDEAALAGKTLAILTADIAPQEPEK